MGSTNGITRGQLRPHFSGRSPPFLLAALCVGLGILGVSYWSLSQQYNDLEEQLKKTLIRKESIENQLNAREEEFSRDRQKIQKTEEELNSVNNQIKTKTDQINDLNSRIELLTNEKSKCDEDLNKKSEDLGDAVSKLKDIEQQKDNSKDQSQELIGLRDENKRLVNELEELKRQLFASKNETKSEVIPKPLVNEKIETNINDFNSLKTNGSVKTEDNSIKSDGNLVDDFKNKDPELVVEPIKPDLPLPSNALAEEDRKEEALVEANNNEIVESELKETEDFKMRPQI